MLCYVVCIFYLKFLFIFGIVTTKTKGDQSVRGCAASAIALSSRLCFTFWTFRLIWFWIVWVVRVITTVISVARSITTNTLHYTILPTKWPNH